MSFDRDAYREQSLSTWRQMAGGWEERREWMAELTGVVNRWVVEQAAPAPGQTFLELACGTGDLGLLVAERLGGEGQVISTDFAPEMVAAAQREAQARGVSGIEHRVLDAERMDLGDDSVDGVVCRWGYMLMADPVAALGETRRVLRDGGPLAFAVWSTADRNPWAALPGMTLVQRGHMPPPEPGAPGIFSMGEPDRIRELVTGAGFAEPEIEEITFEFRYADFAEVWDTLNRITGVVAQVLRELPPDELDATRTAIEESLAPFRRDDGSYVTPAMSLGVLAR